MGVGKTHRSQLLHPVTGKRWNLSAHSAGELAEVLRGAERIAHELRVGAITVEQALHRCDVLSGKRAAHAVHLVTLADAWTSYVATLAHPHTRSKAESVWRLHLAPLGAELVATFTDGRLEELCASWAKKGLSPKMIAHSVWAFLSASIRHAKRSKRIERLPWDEFIPPRAIVKRRPAAATRLADVAKLVATAAIVDDEERSKERKAHTRGVMSELFDLRRRVTVLVFCGLRNGEGAGLAWDHVDLERGTLTVEFQALDQWRKHFPGKTRPDFPTMNAKVEGPLVQKLHPDAHAALREQRDELMRLGWFRVDGPVFPTASGQWRKNANCIYPEDLKALAVRAGVPNAARWVVHSLRHSFATLELASGLDPRAVIARTGHGSIRQLEQYLHASGARPSAIPRLSSVLPATTTTTTKPKGANQDESTAE